MRVTQAGQQSLILSNLGNLNERLLALRMQASTGYRIQDGSEDPVAYSQILTLKSQESVSKGTDEVSTRLSGRLSYYDTVLGQLGDALRNARTLAQQGSTASTDNSTLPLLAKQVDASLETVLGISNDQNEGRYIFAGSKTDTPPYVATRQGESIIGVAYLGDDRPQDVTLDNGQSMKFSVSGSEVFGADPNSTSGIMGVLIGLRDALKAGDRTAITKSLDNLDNVYENVVSARGEVGAREQHLQSLNMLRSNVILQLQTQRDAVQNCDLTTTVSQLMQEQTVWQSALQVASRVDQYNLLSMMR